MHSLENNVQDHLHESGCSGELDKAATQSVEHFDTKDFGKQYSIMESSLSPLYSLYAEYQP